MTILIALDCDGTIDIGSPAGPIAVSRLYEINTPPYIQIVMVSASPFCARLPFPRSVSENTRLENLLAASLRYPALLNIYISDNPGDDINAKNAGFCHIHPKDFSFPLR